MIEELDFEVLEAGDGNQAIGLLKENEEIAVIICDINMPNMNGLEFVEEVRCCDRYNEIPIIMLTTDDEQRMSPTLLNKGAQEYLNKPCTKKDLKIKLHSSILIDQYG